MAGSQTLRSVPSALGRLESELAERRPVELLAELGPPSFVGLLFRLEARRLVRSGPSAEPMGWLSPAGLLEAARRAAAAGLVGASTPVELRRLLTAGASRVRGAGAWRIDRPLWWEPLGAAGELESFWSELDRGLDERGSLPSRQDLEAALGAAAGNRPWLAVPSLLPPGLCGALYREIEAAYRSGALELEPGRVGSTAGVDAGGTAARSDEVRMLSGLEPELLRDLPRLAVLVQWSLERLAARLAESLPDRPAHPPAAAMLARYPGPGAGFRPHLDNPGGAADNGRALSCVLYLGAAPGGGGGELGLWESGSSPPSLPTETLAPSAGSLALFDARSVLHEVSPLTPGPARWSLVVWLNDQPPEDPGPPPLGELTTTDVLLPIESPPVPQGLLLWHELSDADPVGTIVVAKSAPKPLRAGAVSTVYGAGRALETWCRHHLAVGFEHLVLVFDRLEEAAEGAAAERLQELFPPSRLTIWSGARLAEEIWPRLAAETGGEELLCFASRGASPQAVSCRQSLNASAALRAAAKDELGGAPLDWLLHVDHDELFWLQGRGRGGQRAGEHFAALAETGVGLVRYANHELLLPRQGDGRLRFKRNPRLARARLGPVGWRRLAADLDMTESARRPYFNGYVNGKSAVAVGAGAAAAGVHAWTLAKPCGRRFVAGPAVLHFHFASAGGYVRKYLAMASTQAADDGGLFEPCRTDLEARDLVVAARAEGVSEGTLRQRLLALRGAIAGFSAEEEEILEAAGLLADPDLDWPLPVDPLAGPRTLVRV